MYERISNRAEGRLPVIDYDREKELNLEKIEKEWLLITGAVLRNFKTNIELRNRLLAYIDAPLSEDLPDRALEDFSTVDPLIANLYKRYRDMSVKYLKLPTVPQEEITKDITNSGTISDEQTGKLRYGITYPEGRLIGQRYRYARDIKMLALAVEMSASPVKPAENPEPVSTEHGCKVFLPADGDPEVSADLLNPVEWENRKQIKDRIYEVTINGKKFILKEKKTRFHLHTKKGGHQDSLSSKEEFTVAKDLHARGRMKFGGVVLEWEKPLGYVEFPDGFQFAIFSYDEVIKGGAASVGGFGGIPEDSGVLIPLGQEILKRRQEFEKEFSEVALAAETKAIYEPTIARAAASRTERMLLFGAQKLKMEHKRPVKLTYEDFALIKASHLYHKAYDYKKAREEALGYKNQDLDGFAYGFSTRGPFYLHAIGFDMEYMIKHNQPTNPDPDKAFREGAIQIVDREMSREGNILYTGQLFNRIQRAAYRVLLEREKKNLEEVLRRTA